MPFKRVQCDESIRLTVDKNRKGFKNKQTYKKANKQKEPCYLCMVIFHYYGILDHKHK